MPTIIDSDSMFSRREAIRVVVLGDTHEYHRHISVPDGNLLVHVGDITRNSFSRRAVQDFDAWLRGLPHQYKVVILAITITG